MAEPTKLTQAQALFAVLAGGAQARRERVYYRDGVLRSSLYGVLDDADIASASTATMDYLTTNGEITDSTTASAIIGYNIVATTPRQIFEVVEEYIAAATAPQGYHVVVTQIAPPLTSIYEDYTEAATSTTLLCYNVIVTAQAKIEYLEDEAPAKASAMSAYNITVTGV